jgi:hypothetical protein
MNLPGYTAEASLAPRRNPRWSRLEHEPANVHRVVPQVAFAYCYKPEICIVRCCTTTIDYVGPYKIPVVRTTCAKDNWICGHTRPDAGVLYDFPPLQ